MTIHTRNSRRILAICAVAATSFGAFGCSSDSNDSNIADSTSEDNTETTANAADSAVESTSSSTDPQDASAAESSEPTVDEPAAQPADESADVSLSDSLTEDEIAGLLWMREEEQLAHDVYFALHEQWGLRIFENITASESSHIESALSVMETYGVDDPAAENPVGTFVEPQLQELYDRLIAEGSTSLIDALEVGAFIEELDIDDLRIRSAATDNTTLTDLYAKLEKGSRNHLRAFTSQLEGRGVVYQPTQLDQGAYDEILSSSMERGHDA